MIDFQWLYPWIRQEDFFAGIALAETILQRYGAVPAGDASEAETVEKHVWKRNEDYIRVDWIYYTEKPFLILEFSDALEGPYEDADPFPYNLPEEEIEEEIRFALGLEEA